MGLWQKIRSGRADSPVDPADVQQDVDELVAAGKFGDAIDRLTEANRAQPRLEFEQRLVSLRSEAFEKSEWSNERPSWPGSIANPYADTPFPEIPASELSVDNLRSAMTHQGSLHVRGVFTKDQVDALRDGIDNALASYDAVTAGDNRADLGRWYAPFARDKASDRERKRSRGSILTVESPAMMHLLLESFRQQGFDQLVSDYFGERPLLLGRKGTLRRIDHTGNTGGWHQDGAFMGAGIRSLNIWIPLTHCGDTAPGMDLVAQRLDHILPTGEGAFSPWATSPAAAEEAAAGTLVRPIFEAGDALFFDQMNLHRTAIDPGMTEDRHAIETWLLSPSTYEEMMRPNEDGYSPRDQIPIAF